MGQYSYERFTDFVNQVINQLSHVKRIDKEAGEVFEESWDDEEIFFEDYNIDDVVDAITVDYEYDDYDDEDDPDLDGCMDESGEVLADVHGFKLHNGQLYVENTFYAGHGSSTTDWDKLSYGGIHRPVALERAILGAMHTALAKMWNWDLGEYLFSAIEASCDFNSFPPEEGIVPLGKEGIRLLNGKIATAIRHTASGPSITICTKPINEIQADDEIEYYAISPDDPHETIKDFLDKFVTLCKQHPKWELILPKGVTNPWWLDVLPSQFDALVIKDKSFVVGKSTFAYLNRDLKRLRIPKGFMIPENAGLDPSIEVIEEDE